MLSHKRKIEFILLILLIVSIILVITLFNRLSFDNYKLDVEDDIINGCNNLSLFSTAACLSDNVIKIHNYNDSNTGKDITYEELLKQGGVCSHYSILYKKASEYLGFDARYVITEMGDSDSNHIFTIISDATGYCVLDQSITPICVSVK